MTISPPESDLEWDPPNVTCLNGWPLYICDDGSVIYYRDKEEQPKELDEAQRTALQQQQQQQQADSARFVNVGKNNYLRLLTHECLRNELNFLSATE